VKEKREPWTSKHIQWFVKTEILLKTTDGKHVEVWNFCPKNDAAVLSAWAKHFRNHYCLDEVIDSLRYPHSRSEYLTKFKFPCKSNKLGPSIRAGDFGEILVADFLEWTHKCWVPRLRWSSKYVKNESPKGSDVIGFKFHNQEGETSAKDVLLIFESKTNFSGRNNNNLLQDAINSSSEDTIRKDESLNYIKQKFFENNDQEKVKKIERFQNPVDHPYEETYGAAAIFSTECFDADRLKCSNTSEHRNKDNLSLLVIKGPRMMKLVHDLYRRAADEAERGI